MQYHASSEKEDPVLDNMIKFPRLLHSFYHVSGSLVVSCRMSICPVLCKPFSLANYYDVGKYWVSTADVIGNGLGQLDSLFFCLEYI